MTSRKNLPAIVFFFDRRRIFKADGYAVNCDRLTFLGNIIITNPQGFVKGVKSFFENKCSLFSAQTKLESPPLCENAGCIFQKNITNGQ